MALWLHVNLSLPSVSLFLLPPSSLPSFPPPSLLVQPENILLYRKGSLDIKIVDFGLAIQLREGQEVKNLVGTAEYVGESSTYRCLNHVFALLAQ